MNPSMYTHEATLVALETIKRRAAAIVEPVEGDVACGEHGQGKLASIDAIVATVKVIQDRSQILGGERVLITSGPTQEPIDDVRYLSNRSSGKMGAALARAALLMGAKVTVITGPTAEPLPMEANVVRVRTAGEMLKAAKEHLMDRFLVIGAAAVADYRPETIHKGKVRRSDAEITLKLVPNQDILAELAASASPGCRVVGFAAEPDGDTQTALEKIAKKSLFAIAANDVSKPGIGFESDDNELTLVWPDGITTHSGLRSKLGCALWLLDQVSKRTESPP